MVTLHMLLRTEISRGAQANQEEHQALGGANDQESKRSQPQRGQRSQRYLVPEKEKTGFYRRRQRLFGACWPAQCVSGSAAAAGTSAQRPLPFAAHKRGSRLWQAAANVNGLIVESLQAMRGAESCVSPLSKPCGPNAAAAARRSEFAATAPRPVVARVAPCKAIARSAVISANHWICPILQGAAASQAWCAR